MFNIRKAATGWIGLTILTKGLFNLNPVPFVLGTGARGGGGFQGASGTLNISVAEIWDWVGTGNTGGTSLTDALWTNLKANAPMMIGSYVVLGVVDKMLLPIASRQFNRSVRSIGLGKVVKA